jgi:deoxyribose-phosphate aldolase
MYVVNKKGSIKLRKLKKEELAKRIDHTILKPDITLNQVKEICDEAKKYGFASVCVNSCYIPFVKKELFETEVKVCSVVGFPLGAMSMHAKSEETKRAIYDGANEIDMVINIGALKNGDYRYVENDIKAIVDSAGKGLVKVIIETCLLTNEEKVKVCEIAKISGAHFVKTSTGFSAGGATIEDVKLMKEVAGNALGVKASGGIRDLEKAIAMINAGATRIGTSASVAILKEVI